MRKVVTDKPNIYNLESYRQDRQPENIVAEEESDQAIMVRLSGESADLLRSGAAAMGATPAELACRGCAIAVTESNLSAQEGWMGPYWERERGRQLPWPVRAAASILTDVVAGVTRQRIGIVNREE